MKRKLFTEDDFTSIELVTEDEFSVKENFYNQVNDHIGKARKSLKRRSIMTIIAFSMIGISYPFDRYRDFDVTLNSTLFLVLLLLAGVFVVFNLLMLSSKPREDNLKKDYFKFLRLDEIFEVVNVIPVFIAFVVVANTFFVSPATVVKTSMEPNYYEGDKILLYHFFEQYDRFDVTIVKVTDDDYYIKRVIGLPGDKVTLKNESIYINDVLLDDTTELKPGAVTNCTVGNGSSSDDECSFQVPLDEYFVLGDNREGSIDSRTFGTVPTDQMFGKVILKLDFIK